MKYRPLDENGDMMPVQYSSQMLTDTSAVAAAVNSRLKLLRGQWWEDESLGFAIPAFLMQGLRGRLGGDTLLNYILAYILKTQGVTTVASSFYTMVKREFVANIVVNTEFGETIEGSVGMNELLSAVSG